MYKRQILSHVNDAGFWLVKQYFNMTVVETFKTWTVKMCIRDRLQAGAIFTRAIFIGMHPRSPRERPDFAATGLV